MRIGAGSCVKQLARLKAKDAASAGAVQGKVNSPRQNGPRYFKKRFCKDPTKRPLTVACTRTDLGHTREVTRSKLSSVLTGQDRDLGAIT